MHTADKRATLAHYQTQAKLAAQLTANKATPEAEALSAALGPLACESILAALDHREFALAGMIVEALRRSIQPEPLPVPDVSDSDFGAFQEAQS